MLLQCSPRREGAGPSARPLCHLTPAHISCHRGAQAGSTPAHRPPPTPARASPEQAASSRRALPHAPREGFGVRGCSQRAPRPGQALPPASASTRSPSTLRIPVGALPGGKAEKPELDPAGKQQGCCAGLAEPGQSPRQGRTAAPVHPQPSCNVTTAMQPGWRRSGSGPEQGHPGWPESTGMGSGRSPRCPRHRRAGWPGAGGSQGISREQSGCWQPASGRASLLLPLQLGSGKSTKSTGSLCLISLATPAPSQAWPTGAPGHNALLRETESSGQAQQRPVCTG